MTMHSANRNEPMSNLAAQLIRAVNRASAANATQHARKRFTTRARNVAALIIAGAY